MQRLQNKHPIPTFLAGSKQIMKTRQWIRLWTFAALWLIIIGVAVGSPALAQAPLAAPARQVAAAGHTYSPAGRTLEPARHSPQAAANIWYVAATGDDNNSCQSETAPCATVAGAMGKASDGDTILIAAGVYAEHLTIDKSLTLRGSGSGDTILDGGSSGRVVTVPAGHTVVLEYLTIRNGRVVGERDLLVLVVAAVAVLAVHVNVRVAEPPARGIAFCPFPCFIARRCIRCN